MSLVLSLTALGSSRRDQVERIVEAGLAEQGRVFALSLEPVRQSLGDRWAHKREQVWEAAERALERGLPPPDVFLRVDETTFLAAMASTDAYEGQVRCAEILRGLLTFFLGRSADDDIVLQRATRLGVEGMSLERVDPFSPRPPNPRRGPIDVEPVEKSPEDWVPPLSGRRHVATLFTAAQRVELELEIEPIWRLDQGVIGAYRIRRILRGVGSPSAAQAEAMDQATIDFLLPILDEYRREGGFFALIIPLNFGSVSASRPRMGLIGRWAGAADLVRQVVMLELAGVNQGVPTGSVGMTAALLSPFFKGLLLQVSDEETANVALREHAFHGAVIDAAGLMRRSGLGGLIRAVRRLTRNVMLLNAPRALDDRVLATAGVSHVVWMDEPVTASDSDVRQDASAPA